MEAGIVESMCFQGWAHGRLKRTTRPRLHGVKDLLIIDRHFTPGAFHLGKNWGHSTAHAEIGEEWCLYGDRSGCSDGI